MGSLQADEDLKLAYLEKQKRSSKMVRSCKRMHRKIRNYKLLENLTSNPKQFWKFKKNLGGMINGDLPDTITRSGGIEI